MPKLVVFTACEKILIDDTQSASLIVLLHGLTISSSQGKEIAENAVVPKEWAVYTSWRIQPGEENKDMTQVVQVLWPDGSEFHKHVLPFKFKAGKGVHQNRISIIGFPAGQRGSLKVNMWLEREGAKITETYSYLIDIERG